MDKPVIAVALALVLRNGLWLVARRPRELHAGGLWEFPGGKQHADEAPAQAVCRELLEECNVHATPLEVLAPVACEYDDRVVRLTPVLCRWEGGEPRPAASDECRWVPSDELLRLPMPPANAGIVQAVLRHLGLHAAH